jgi:hypothetical protein
VTVLSNAIIGWADWADWADWALDSPGVDFTRREYMVAGVPFAQSSKTYWVNSYVLVEGNSH